MSLTKKKYNKEPDWEQKFKDSNVTLSASNVAEGWQSLFKTLISDSKFKLRIENELSNLLKENRSVLLYPKPDYVFKAFEMTDFSDVKVVFIGQDPYFNHENIDDSKVPQAMGLSFSVPKKMNIPSSLSNIYKNLLKYGHINEMPSHGNLSFWAYQGCLMLNTALTVVDNEKKCHSFNWKWFTDEIIKYISEKSKYCVFVLWGSDAFEKSKLINLDKHDVVISSHPSGLSADKPMKEYPAFNKCDHFGTINKLLVNKKMTPIYWQL